MVEGLSDLDKLMVPIGIGLDEDIDSLGVVLGNAFNQNASQAMTQLLGLIQRLEDLGLGSATTAEVMNILFDSIANTLGATETLGGVTNLSEFIDAMAHDACWCDE